MLYNKKNKLFNKTLNFKIKIKTKNILKVIRNINTKYYSISVILK